MIASDVPPDVGCSSAVYKDYIGTGGREDASTVLDTDSSDDNSADESVRALAYADSPVEIIEYEEVPHKMGRSDMPTFVKRPAKPPVSFKATIESLAERVDESGIWDCLTLSLIDQPTYNSVLPDSAITKKKRVSRSLGSGENPVENERHSTIDLFLARGLANFLKLQVDVIRELETNYDDLTGSIDPADVFADPLTDEGGTAEAAYWNYGVDSCTALLEAVVPKEGTFLIDLDKDEIVYFDADTYRWL